MDEVIKKKLREICDSIDFEDFAKKIQEYDHSPEAHRHTVEMSEYIREFTSYHHGVDLMMRTRFIG